MAKIVAEFNPVNSPLIFRVTCRATDCYLHRSPVCHATETDAKALALGHFMIKSHPVVVEDLRAD